MSVQQVAECCGLVDEDHDCSDNHGFVDPENFVLMFKRGLEERYPFCCVLAFCAEGTGAYGRLYPLRCDGRGFVACSESCLKRTEEVE